MGWLGLDRMALEILVTSGWSLAYPATFADILEPFVDGPQDDGPQDVQPQSRHVIFDDCEEWLEPF